MINITEFQYSNVSQRKFIYINTFLLSTITCFLLFDFIHVLKFYFAYFAVFKYVCILGLAGVFFGNMLGKILFSAIQRYRGLVGFTDGLIIVILLVYCFRNGFNATDSDALILVFNYSPTLLAVLIFSFALFVAVKLHYLLKLACADFIDEKQGIIPLVVVLIAGAILGTVIIFAKPLVFTYYYYSMALFSVYGVATYFLHLPYEPQPLYAQNYGTKKDKEEKNNFKYKDSLVFSYLNVSFIVVYIFLSYNVTLKFMHSVYEVKMVFIFVALIAGIIGFFLARIFTFSYNHVLSEALYPVFFFPFVIALYIYSGSIDTKFILIAFVCLFLLFGFSLSKTLRHIMSFYKYKERFRIINFAFIVIPVPILIAFSYLDFTNRWFFVILYVSAFFNIMLPGIYLINSDLSKIRKSLYFVFLLLIIPLVIIANLGFNIPLDNALFKKNISGFNELKNVNYVSPYIKNKIMIKYNGSPIFKVSDSIIRNYKRVLLFSQSFRKNSRSNYLLLDGTQRFFRNPVIGYMKRSVCLDYLFDRNVDFNILPFSGKQRYIPDNEYLMFFLKSNVNRFDVIIDMPNLHDQGRPGYRFTKDYYLRINKHLNKKGVLISLYTMPDCSVANLKESLVNLKAVYAYHNVYLFSNILFVVSSDDRDALTLDYKKYNLLEDIAKQSINGERFFYSRWHILSKLVFVSIDQLLELVGQQKKVRSTDVFFAKGRNSEKVYSLLVNYHKETGKVILGNLSEEGFSKKATDLVRRDLNKNAKILHLLKMTELSEASEMFDEETRYLFELKRLMEYNIPLKEYLVKFLSYKEAYYYNAAKRLEEEKRWLQAKNIYKAILLINKDNFDANYNLGILSLTLQEMDNAFIYLQNAMKLKKKHPKVLYQMGVLYYSRGQIKEAISYFNRALAQREKSSAIFLYLGMCYDEKENFNEAEYYYKKALVEDPNDVNIITRLENIKRKIEKEKNKWKLRSRTNQNEEEYDEEILLPVNKSAYDIRLKDTDETKK